MAHCALNRFHPLPWYLGLARTSSRRFQDVENALKGALFGYGLDFLNLLGFHHRDRALNQITHHRVNIAADVANLGELGGLNLGERRVGEVRKPAGDLGLADAGGTDH